MKLEIQVVIADDSLITTEKTINGITVFTGDPLDPEAARGEFLEQATLLLRGIGENQIPALYDTVVAKSSTTPPEAAEVVG